MRICVTGAAGFIGSNVVRSLEERRLDVIKCDPRDSRMISSDSLISLIDKEKIDALIHLGAISSTTETDTESLCMNNILLSCALLERCIKKEIPFSYASSASVYGDRILDFSEDLDMTPLNYYAISKASFDYFVLKKIHDNPEAKIFGMRYFNVYGSNEDHKKDMASPIYKFFNQSIKDKKIRIFEGSENFKRDFVHVKDASRITIDSLEFKNSGIYNVGTGNAVSFKEIAQNVSRFTGSDIVEIPFPKHLEKNYQSYTCSNNKKISNETSESRISIYEGTSLVAKDLLSAKK